MVGLLSVYHCAKRTASACPISGLYTTTRTLRHSPPRPDLRRDETVDHNASAITEPRDETPQTTKTKKKFSELPKLYILPDGSIAKPLEQWQSGDDGLLTKSVDLDYAAAGNLLRQIETRTSVSDMVEESKFEDVEETIPKARRRKKKEPETTEQQESLKPKKRPRKKDTEANDAVPKKPKRVVKPKAVEASDGLPQGILADEIRENLSKFPHCLLLTRVGNFYESYFDQAIEISKILNIKLASRKWGGGRVPMCGFPLQHIDKHLKVMVQQHKRFVAMCEEFPQYTSSDERKFERRVVRVITPGTLIDESFLNQYENNYLLAVSAPPEDTSGTGSPTLGLAWIDVSTGEFYSKRTSFGGLRDEITRIGPQEIVLHKDLEERSTHPAIEAAAEEGNVVSFVTPLSPPVDCDVDPDTSLTPRATEVNVTDEITMVQDTSPFVYTTEETAAIALLTTYLRANLLEHMPPLLLPNREDSGNRMQIDSHTIKALEIRESMREGGVRGSLLSSVKRTITTSGTRLLARWLLLRSRKLTPDSLLSLFFHSRPHFRSDLLGLLAKAEDAGRIVQKFLLGKGDPNDLLALTATVNIWSNLQYRVNHEREAESIEQRPLNAVEWASLDVLMNRMVNLQDLAQRISLAVESPALSQLDEPFDLSEEDNEFGLDSSRLQWRYGRMKFGIKIKPEFSPALLELNTLLKDLWKQKAKMEEKLQLKYDAPSLTLRSSPGQGMHVHLAKSKRDHRLLSADPTFVSMNETGTTRTYFYQDWAQLGQKIFTTSIDVLAAEKEAFETLRQEVNLHAPSLRRNARVLDELDVTLAFAQLAIDMNFVRPSIQEDATYNVVNGRHPTVELGLLTSGRVFTPNTVTMTPSSQFHVITGPNMAGKSTLLRQTALIAILAQSGSFVPADAATLGIADKLFSRVGAKDDLFHDRSTFMVEMLETAEILRRATPRSLVIMDEVGRGTTVKDGIALAFATIHHLVTVNRCRTLFATHFHELSDMLGYTESSFFGQGIFETVAFHCTSVDEIEAGSFSYSYRLRPGVNRDSHGLKVAQLAGMPHLAVAVAQNVLTALKGKPTIDLDPDELASIGQTSSMTV
ncbi:muts domain V-domain-containing protein [Rhodocollybia butyracea]|uniref:Muts domain V-domain-containing protein n=1 Tax=Rhodocollybia butyracea TaxID=206335 RepID=A0A9P5PRS1_9AGAR|nr:muts domain V-domain-containing protein [Rhodocollybia butyracea]